MDINRRKFIKFGGACALGLGVMPLVNVVASNNPKFLPSSKALAGNKWGMAIDMSKCDYCNDCIDACHLAHNVPSIGNTKEEVKWLWTEPHENALPYQSHDYVDESTKNRDVLVLCNHCENPSCVRVCPTQATFKRKDGVVMMDYHRCIGCRYCMAACPYGARSFNFSDPRPHIEEVNKEFPTRTKGVVEKCNLCDERLSVGLPPACVEACPNGVFTFGDLDDPNSDVRKLLASSYNIQRKISYGTKPKIYYIV
ncbi:MAG: 4Fe-4S ferredoxin [Desulfitibacter sp. BRH_c19]|nr:MAG: 4Fe-4S ferredoxin [Desulfitibacter sp. BRH_c19]